jgi:predicted hotdog family 3-hydroxylacyl-ACP dehydratase
VNPEEIDIHELLPQQEPFVMIGRLSVIDDNMTQSQTLITESNIFVSDGLFTQSGIIENIAQTCAARIGYINKYILKKDIQLGFIGAIRGLSIERLPAVGELITTEIEIIESVFGMTLVEARVSSDQGVIANSSMKIAIKNGSEV